MFLRKKIFFVKKSVILTQSARTLFLKKVQKKHKKTSKNRVKNDKNFLYHLIREKKVSKKIEKSEKNKIFEKNKKIIFF